MEARLGEWQQRLEAHFESLARRRKEAGSHIFALEHGLSQEELDQVRPALRSHRRVSSSLTRHWLLWVVYATELGYDYAGDEYWRSFEAKTPYWEYRYRARIKTDFRKFQRTFQGVVPSGPWAEHFRIIAWPITHAILPLYLQRQFARALYELRFQLASATALEPRKIGRLLAVHEQHASTRFQEFLQQEDLTGRIVLALLGAEASQCKAPLHRPTLDRLLADLEKVRRTREWLKETRRVVSDRFKGIGRGTGLSPGRRGGALLGGLKPELAEYDVRPNLLLRHAGEGRWSVFLEVPSFRDVAAHNAEVHAFLQRTRCRLNGGGDMKPTGWLLSGRRKGILRSWPDGSKPLIEFERPHALVDNLLEFECRLSSGTIWLFRIGKDGMAREITGHVVRPDHDYILVSRRDLPHVDFHAKPCKLDCAGVKAFRLAIPPQASASLTAWLGTVELQVARTIRVWSAGLPARGWDGDGRSEWLTTEIPFLGIAHDHPVDAYTFRLNDEPETMIPADGTGDAMFVRLPRLPVGTHELRVTARRSPALEAIAATPAAKGYVELRVREPEPWTRGVGSHPGFTVYCDPTDADLDTFWRNNLRLSVHGPKRYHVTFTVGLESADGREILCEQVGRPMSLPVTQEAWRRRLEGFLKPEELAWSYVEAASGTLTIEGQTLGRRRLRFEHDALPVRWAMTYKQHKVTLRLVDDSGQVASDPKIFFYSLERPAQAVPYEVEQARSGIDVDPPGGLFLAEHGSHADSVVISAILPSAGLKGLGVTPRFGQVARSAHSLGATLRLLGLWQAPRLAGFLVSIRHRIVMDGLIRVFYEAVCGANWADAEARFRKKPKSLAAFGILTSRVDKRCDFALALRREHSRINKDNAQRVRWFADVASHFNICRDSRLSEFALRLASQPGRFGTNPSHDLQKLLGQITNNPAILRGARLLALLSAAEGDEEDVPVLPRWQW